MVEAKALTLFRCCRFDKGWLQRSARAVFPLLLCFLSLSGDVILCKWLRCEISISEETREAELLLYSLCCTDEANVSKYFETFKNFFWKRRNIKTLCFVNYWALPICRPIATAWNVICINDFHSWKSAGSDESLDLILLGTIFHWDKL